MGGAQSIQSNFADTSSYDYAGFRVVDRYEIATPYCYDQIDVTPAVEGSNIRLAIRLSLNRNCGHASSQFEVIVDRQHALAEPLRPGEYAVEFGYWIGEEWVSRARSTLHVDDGMGKCGRFPDLADVILEVDSIASADRIEAVIRQPSVDPAMYAALVKPVDFRRFEFDRKWMLVYYSPLADTQDIARVLGTGGKAFGVTGVWSDSFVCSMGPPADALTLVEFFNGLLGHYFMTADRDEMAAIDRGTAGPGWQRTGEVLKGYVAGPCGNTSFPNATPLFRFYGTRGIGPNSHFFTADRRECGAVKYDPGWTFETAPFRIWAADGGRCPDRSLTVFRLYNDRAAQNDSNHRYTSKASIVTAMSATGWRSEGIAFCIPQ
jgi:hypothetical protein